MFRGSSITASMTLRTSWASCSKLRTLPRCSTWRRRRRRKVKSKVLKVNRDAWTVLHMILKLKSHCYGSWCSIFLCFSLNNRRLTHCKSPPSSRGGICRYLPEIQILLQPVGVYTTMTRFPICYLAVTHSEWLYLYLWRLVWSQQSPTLHQKSSFTTYSNLWIWWVL